MARLAAPLPVETLQRRPLGAPALEVTGLTFRYGRRLALDGVGFDVRPGEVTLVLGPNGAGKTTLFSIIAGLFRPQAGRVAIAGRPLRAGPAALTALGVVFQHTALDLDLTVAQNLRYAAALGGLTRAEAREAIARELGALAIPDRAGDKVRALSGGQRRRVEIARALLHRPAVLLLDEPTVGLDIPTREALITHLHARARAEGTAILWATHLIDEVWPDDRLVVLVGGRVRAAGAVPEVLAATATPTLGEAFGRLTAPEGEAR